MKKIILLTILLFTSFSTFALELDFWSSESFCYQSPNVQNRNGVLYIPNQQEPFTGENLCVFTNGQHHSKGSILNGLFDGKWTFWYEHGIKNQEVNFKEGKFNGKEIVWHLNGQLSSEVNYKDDLKVGKQTMWHSNGQKLLEGNFQDVSIGKYNEIGAIIDNLKMFFGIDFDKINEIKLTKNQRSDLLSLLLKYYQLHLHGFKKPKSLIVLNQIFE